MKCYFQEWVLEQIVAKFENKNDALTQLSKDLEITKDGVYRRLRSQTLLSSREVRYLAQRYQISLDAFVFGRDSSVIVRYNPFKRPIRTFEDYIDGILQELQQIATLPNVRIHYASPELPIFYLCFLPELFAFKLYIWGRTVWDFEYLQSRPFDFELIPYPFLARASAILDYFVQIPSTELWSLSLIDFTLSQIEYYAKSDVFVDNSIAVVLCDKLNILLDHMEEMAKYGQKFKIGAVRQEKNDSNFYLYHNEMLYTDHTILVQSDNVCSVFTSFGNPNFMNSQDTRLVAHIEYWFGKLLSKSHPISSHAEKARKRYFKKLRQKVRSLKRKI